LRLPLSLPQPTTPSRHPRQLNPPSFPGRAFSYSTICPFAHPLWLVLASREGDGPDLVKVEIDDEGAEIGCHRRRMLARRTFVPGAQRQCPHMEGLYRLRIGGTQANMCAGIIGRHQVRPAVKPEFRISLSKTDRRIPRDQTAKPKRRKNGICGSGKKLKHCHGR